MTRHDNRDRKARKTTARTTIPPSRLDAMIEEAIVDAYNEAEQAVGFHATIEQHLAASVRGRGAGNDVDRRENRRHREGRICRGLLPRA